MRGSKLARGNLQQPRFEFLSKRVDSLTQKKAGDGAQLPTHRGKDNVRKMIASIFEPAKKAHFDLIHVFGKGNRVITERLDKWDWDGSGTWQLKLHVCGMFELTEDGKIYEWREYYDNENWTNDGGPSLVM